MSSTLLEMIRLLNMYGRLKYVQHIALSDFMIIYWTDVFI